MISFNKLIVFFVFLMVLFEIRSEFLGYNELNLIEEQKPFRIQCLSKNLVPEELKIKNIKWFNVTKKSTDSDISEHSRDVVPITDDNEFVSIGPENELYSDSAGPEHNGYYTCRVHYSYQRHSKQMEDFEPTDYRLHLIEVIKRPVKSDPENPDQEFDCPTGYYLETTYCRPCPSGKYRPNSINECIQCPPNTYNSYFGQSKCVECPEKSKTGTADLQEEGATDVRDCKFFYSQGFFGFLKDLYYD